MPTLYVVRSKPICPSRHATVRTLRRVVRQTSVSQSVSVGHVQKKLSTEAVTAMINAQVVYSFHCRHALNVVVSSARTTLRGQISS